MRPGLGCARRCRIAAEFRGAASADDSRGHEEVGQSVSTEAAGEVQTCCNTDEALNPLGRRSSNFEGSSFTLPRKPVSTPPLPLTGCSQPASTSHATDESENGSPRASRFVRPFIKCSPRRQPTDARGTLNFVTNHPSLLGSFSGRNCNDAARSPSSMSRVDLLTTSGEHNHGRL